MLDPRTRERVEALLRRALGQRGEAARVRFVERGRRFDCVVPDDALWSGVLFILLLRAYERAGLCLADVDGPIIDAGAHAGLFALQASAYGHRVLAIEAHPANFAFLEENVSAARAEN